MILKNCNGRDLEINLLPFTQLASLDSSLANRVYGYIKEYFSSYRFSEDDLNLYNDQLPKIISDGIEVSRSKYLCIGISSFEDIDKALESKKDSPLLLYNKVKLEKVDIQNELEKLENQFNLIVEKIKLTYPSSSLVEFEDILLNSDAILTKNINSFISKKHSSFEKLMQLLEILRGLEVSLNQEYILFLHNVESYLTFDQLLSIKGVCKELSNVTLILSTNNSSFLDYTEVENINFLKDNNVFNLPDILTLLKKLNSNFPRNKHFVEAELIEFLKVRSFSLIEKTNHVTQDFDLILEVLLKPTINKNFDPLKMENCLII